MATEEPKKSNNVKASLDTKSLITIVAVIVAVGSLGFAGISHMRGEDQVSEAGNQSQTEQSDKETNDDTASVDNQQDGETNDDTKATPSPSVSPATQK